MRKRIKLYVAVKAAVKALLRYSKRKKHEQGLTSANCALNRGEVDGEILSSRKWTRAGGSQR